MYKAGAKINPNEDDGDWETDPDFINNVTEQEQRWGSKTIEGSGRTVGAIDMNKLREETTRAHELSKQKQKDDGAFGYGGKFGIEKDRMDKSAVGHDYVAKVEKHVSQTDYSAGFGGKFGVQTDRVDKSAVSWDHKENISKHASQKDYSQGFGGKFGVEKDRQDKSAVGWDYVEKLHKHDSQTKNENIITEQIQRPSQLKAKFENLAKQNEAKPVEKAKIPQKKTPVVAGFSTAQRIQEPVKTVTIEKKEDKIREEIREARQEFKQEARQELRQEARQEVRKEARKEFIQEAKQEYRQEARQEVRQARQEVRQETRQEARQETRQEVRQETRQEVRQETRKEIKQSVIPPPQPQEPVQPIPPVITEQTAPIVKEVNANIIVDKDEADELVDQLENESNYTAIALYDYQAAAEDEISFDPDDIITNIEMIDEGWWRGTCHGVTGLFPANYVQLQDA